MIFREHTPDRKKDSTGLPITVLPAGHMLKGRYKVEYMGGGGMSIIYKAEAEGTRYIIKEVDGTLGNEVIALNSEKATLERLNHPGIVKIEELFEEEGYFYLVLEYIEGESLQKKIPRSDTVFLSEKVVIDWARQLMDIFDYLHKQNPPIIYRDLKPHNVILDSTGTIKLIDFGIARLYKEKKQEDTVKMGSIMTASPEHYGEGQTDVRSDIYTLGATLYYLLANNPPTGHDIFNFPPLRERNPKVSEKTSKVIAKALQFSPDARFQTIAEMREALFGTKASRETAHMPSSEIAREAERKKAKRAKPYPEKDDTSTPVPVVKKVPEKTFIGSEDAALTAPLALKKIICPSCSTANLDDSLFCEHCGASLKKDKAVRSAVPQSVEEAITTRLERSAVIPEKPPQAKTPMAGRRAPFPLVPALIGLAFVLGIIILIALTVAIVKSIRRPVSIRPSPAASSPHASATPSKSPTERPIVPSKAPVPSMTPVLSMTPVPSMTPVLSMTPVPSPSAPAIEPSPAATHFPEEVDRLMGEGRKALNEKSYLLAEKQFRAALGYDFTNPDARWYLGQCYEGEHKKKEALKAYAEYLKTIPRDPARLRHIAALYTSTKSYDKALEVLRRAQRLDGSAEGALTLGRCYMEKGDYEGAIGAFREALKKNRNDYGTLILIGQCQRKKGATRDAIGAYRAAYDARPGQLSLLFQIALMAEEMGDYDTSKKNLKRYLVLETNESRCAEAEKVLDRVKIKGLKNIPAAVEQQTDFIDGVRVMGILKFGNAYKAYLEVQGDRHEVVEGNLILSIYHVLSIKENRIVLTRDETYYVLRPQ
jgi:serine/threonine protein kinase/tetratricopeptide (TPR) repeat protein